MDDYPADISTFREKQNLPNQPYDEDKKTTVFVEDFTRLESELQSVEEVIGTDPLGGHDSLKDRFSDDEALIASKQDALGFTAVPNTRTVNGHALSADVTVTKSDVSLGSVDNVQQMPISYLDTDGTLAANSDTKVASQKAVKTFAQPKDSDLTTIAGLTATTNNFMQAKSSAWASRTPAQVAIDILPYIYPIGCIYTSTNSTNPATSLGFGTWSAFGAGRVPVGFDSGQTEFDTDEETGGAKTHTLSTGEIPAHNHNYATTRGNIGWTGGSGQGSDPQLGNGNTTVNTGGGGAHNNLQPYIVVRMWKRTA